MYYNNRNKSKKIEANSNENMQKYQKFDKTRKDDKFDDAQQSNAVDVINRDLTVHYLSYLLFRQESHKNSKSMTMHCFSGQATFLTRAFAFSRKISIDISAIVM